MTDGEVKTEVTAPANPPATPQSAVPTTPGGALNASPAPSSAPSVPEIRVEQAPQPLIQTEEPKSIDASKKSYAFVLPAGSTDDDKQAFADILANAKKEGKHVVLRPDVKVVEL